MDEFHRARTPEQREARRAAILQVTSELVERVGVVNVSLNEIAREVGLAKSNVLRYFESREAILLQLLENEYVAWAGELALHEPRRGRESPHEHAARRLASSVMARPLLCELLATAPTMLERNISAETALQHRTRLRDAALQVLDVVAAEVGPIDPDRARAFFLALQSFTATVWTAARPSPAVESAYRADPELDTLHVRPEAALREVLTTFLLGLGQRRPDFAERLHSTGDEDAPAARRP